MRFEPCKQNFKTHDAIASHLRDSGKHKQNPNRSLISVPTTSGANVNQSQSTLGSNSAFDDLDLGGGLSVPKQLRNFKFMLGTLGSADKEKIAQLTKVTHDKMTHSKMVFEVIRNRMYSALAQQLLPVMYLINLIVKNHPVPFELLFQSRIASDFCIAMKDSIPADDRSYFYNLRSTWPLLYNNQAHSF